MTQPTHAFVFPGQGSQSLEMLAGLASAYSSVEQTFEQASDSLDYDLWALCQKGPLEELNSTEKTQPIMLTAGVAVARVWAEQGGVNPLVCAGHSLGEYTALVQSEALAFEDALHLVAERGWFMQNAVAQGEGAMAAILGLDDDSVIKACEEAAQGDIVSAANFNSPGQVVIAGQTQAVERAISLCKAAKARRAVILPVSVPSHCALMQPAAKQLANRLQEININTPKTAILHNVDIKSHTQADNIRQALVEQLYQPIRWVQTVETLIDGGVSAMIECGPGKVLTGLNKRINRAVHTLPVFDAESLDKALQTLEEQDEYDTEKREGFGHGRHSRHW